MSTFDPLPEGAGYAVVVGLGSVFAILMCLTTFFLKRYTKEIMTSEEFVTCNHAVKTGLISCAIVSSWTWSATLLCTPMVSPAVSIKVKLRSPNCRTYLELIYVRYGKVTHIVFIIWGLMTNIMVTAMLLTGGASVVHMLTGMNPAAACILTVLSCVGYAVYGGLKAVILGDYVHTILMLSIMLVFGFVTWVTSDRLGSIDLIYDLVTEYALKNPKEGNAGGSYLTIKSESGGIFFIINIISAFGTVFLDQGYLNKAISADPKSTYKGYILGGLAWWPIPCFISVTAGLGAIALQQTKYWPIDRPLTPDEVASGLVLPTFAVALMGKAGGVLTLLMLFMAITSAFSAQLISVSSIFTYDIYRTYFNPNASGTQLIRASHVAIVVFAALLSGFSIMLYYLKVSMGYLFTLLGIVLSSGVLPQCLTILWNKQSWMAATLTPPIGTCLSITFWLVVTKLKYGSVTYDNTFQNDSVLTGNCVSLLAPLITIPILTYIKPQNFDWDKFLIIKRVDEEDELKEVEKELEIDVNNNSSSESNSMNKTIPIQTNISIITNDLIELNREKFMEERKILSKAFKRCVITCISLTLALLVLWPMPMYGTSYIFSKPFFRGWIIVLFIWLFYTVFQVVLYPIWESRHTLSIIMKGIYWDLSGQSYKLKEWQLRHPEELHVVQSQINAQLNNELCEQMSRGQVRYIDDSEKR
ncbi:DUR3 [Candida pseudojiufengensis]|uniref:DUR3 n=1 Tax=Candida pseudojiufengensis TaxID=497109 RepID=UPI0022254B20|nr:DUR3 [Candida pseudojiufengensis]KAI5961911.1 DUR3 [Candida pseudojiufengensis]